MFCDWCFIHYSEDYLCFFFFSTRQFTWKHQEKIPNQQTRRMSPVSIETPGKHQDHESCTQETYSYWNGWCSRMLSNFDNLPLSQPTRSPKGIIDTIKFWSLLMVSRQPSSFWGLQDPNPNLQMDLCTVTQEKPGPPFPESPGSECPTGTAQASPPDRLQRGKSCQPEAQLTWYAGTAQDLLFTAQVLCCCNSLL